jgi:hypothetical protein
MRADIDGIIVVPAESVPLVMLNPWLTDQEHSDALLRRFSLCLTGVEHSLAVGKHQRDHPKTTKVPPWSRTRDIPTEAAGG